MQQSCKEVLFRAFGRGPVLPFDGPSDILLTSGKIDQNTANSLSSKINVAISSLRRGQSSVAVAQLKSLLKELDDLVATGAVIEADIAPLRTLVNRVIASVS
jgi:hypothetical protein